jgi:hypothetical protein
MTPEETNALIDRHLTTWIESDEGPTLREVCAAMLTEALDTIDGKELASQLRRADEDREAWFRKYLAECEKVRELERRIARLLNVNSQ